MATSKRITIYPKGALQAVAHLRDFDGDVQQWKNAFYELWRYQMTWSFAHEIIVQESRANGVFVRVTFNRTYEGVLTSTMENLGYRDIKIDGVVIGWTDDGIEFDGEYIELIDID